jgi:hypothetical protein
MLLLLLIGVDWSFASIVPHEEFGHFHASTTSRLPFLFQNCDEEVLKDRQYFLAGLEEDREQRGFDLDLTELLESEYTEMASCFAAVELKRPKCPLFTKTSSASRDVLSPLGIMVYNVVTVKLSEALNNL